MIDHDSALSLYRTMLRIRLFEERVVKLLEDKEIYGPAHLYIGQEAVAAGVCHHLRRDDYVASTHRGHGHLIAKGGRTDRMMAELFARRDGYCKGKGGSMHIADMALGILGANGIVGAGSPLALGAAFSCQYLRNGLVSVAFFGDGAANQGLCLESLNLAAACKLPLVFVCENNGYGVNTPWKAVSASSVAARAEGFGMPGVELDGQDVEAVATAAGEAVERARTGGGPTLLECLTYRQMGHCGIWGDPRPKEEVAAWHRRDPLELLGARIRQTYPAMASLLESARVEIAAEIAAAVAFAKASPPPALTEALEDVYAGAGGNAARTDGGRGDGVAVGEDVASKYWEK